MSVNPDSIPRYAEYPAETDPTPLDCMESCKHEFACLRAYRMFVDSTEYERKREIAQWLHCAECEEFE